ncbi:formyl transferase [Echinicola vietnamensis]|uniref:Methionyl-tRNA formyltransferase n=1 Tax=Echinicola vietnamensis (strain DSM 17526 / LMG 23754 / KMM 6221) TaxID=926556 RepID=L0FTL6_ECHVK|nr:formyl transferase [Echinicola vietnamensis]AGA77259.1 methionyl-tRNA formyltransferase [Echinicola vietnamensis DSM 17526]
MKIVVISECKAREMIVINKILQFQPRTVVVQPTFGKKKKKRSVEMLIKRLLTKFRYQRLKRKIAEKGIEHPDILNRVPFDAQKLNAPEGVEFLKRLSPDLLITCRAPLLSNEITQIAKIATINIHYGIAPEYRGNDTLFWALYHKDYQHIGGTIHHISQGVDTGNILARAYPALAADDDETSVDIKTSTLLGEALYSYLQKLSQARQPILGVIQHSKGTNYRAKDRTVQKSLTMLFRNMIGKATIPLQNQKVETHFDEESISIFA